MSETFMSPSILSRIHHVAGRGTFTIRAALKGMRRQSTAQATGVIVVITQLQ